MGAMNLIGKAKTEVEDSEDDMICVSKKGKPYNQLEMHKLGGGEERKRWGEFIPIIQKLHTHQNYTVGATRTNYAFSDKKGS
jgi:hypothetical protein